MACLPLLATSLGPAAGQLTAQERPPAPSNPWQEMARNDVAAMTAAVRSGYIYAVLPPDPAWPTRFAAASARATDDIGKVRDFPGYQAVLRRYADAFQDAHLNVRFAFDQTMVRWPQFLVRYRADHYVVVGSTVPNIRDGAVVSACDGLDMSALVDKVAPEAGRLGFGDSRVPGIEATRASMAHALFVDIGNPFYARPTRCTIGGIPIDLDWRAIAASQLARVEDGQGVSVDRGTRIDAFDDAAVWVRMGTFNPTTPAERAQWRAVIDGAAALREKSLIVLDVRGNSGGPYNWFVAFLEALYGQDYADFHARARLQVRPVLLADDLRERNTILTDARNGRAPGDGALPTDRNLDFAVSKATEGTRNGHTVITLEPQGAWPASAKVSPPNPVKARVLVLTDYGCQSACIAFVDELRRFPGVIQVGGETGVDSRSGTTKPVPLPSGSATLYLPSMTRIGRERGDNVPWRPDLSFDGNLADTGAVRAWIRRQTIFHGSADDKAGVPSRR